MGKLPDLAAEGAASRRRYVALPMAQLLPDVTRAAYKDQSPAGAVLLSDWPGIVGPTLAASSQARRLHRGQLTIACTGAVAMELQHLQQALIGRINMHLGETLVTRLRFVHDIMHTKPASVRPRARVAREPVEGVAGPLAEALSDLLQSIRERG